MKRLGQCYVQTFNKAHNRTGTLWEGRFYSCLVPTESYVLACYRYIELNPVRAKLVSSPASYPWSSFSTNAGCEESSFITRHQALAAIGRDYLSLFDMPVEDEVLAEIRKATRNGHTLGVPRKPRGRSSTAERQSEMGSVPISGISGQGSLGL